MLLLIRETLSKQNALTEDKNWTELDQQQQQQEEEQQPTWKEQQPGQWTRVQQRQIAEPFRPKQLVCLLCWGQK